MGSYPRKSSGSFLNNNKGDQNAQDMHPVVCCRHRRVVIKDVVIVIVVVGHAKKLANFNPHGRRMDFSETKHFVLNYSFHFGSFFFLLRKEVGDNNKKYLLQGNFFPSFN